VILTHGNLGSVNVKNYRPADDCWLHKKYCVQDS